MSILRDYETIRQRIGGSEYNSISGFLESHPAYLLSDVYYNETVAKEYNIWVREVYLKNRVVEE